MTIGQISFGDFPGEEGSVYPDLILLVSAVQDEFIRIRCRSPYIYVLAVGIPFSMVLTKNLSDDFG